jgi:hypothetical protein
MNGQPFIHGQRMYREGLLRVTVQKSDMGWDWFVEHGVANAERGPYVEHGTCSSSKEAMQEGWTTLWAVQGFPVQNHPPDV